MKIEKVIIWNFRSIQKGEFYINNILCIVGSNNSGKSAVLRAINSFFNFEEEKDHFINGVHQYSKSSIAKIELVFTNVPAKSIYNSKINSDKKLYVQISFNKDGKNLHYKYKKSSKYIDTEESILLEIKKDIQYVYIPIIRDHNQIITSEKTILKRVLDVFLENHTKKRDILTPKVVNAGEYLNKIALNKVAKEIGEKYLHNRNFEISIKHSNALDYKVLIDDLQVFIQEKGRSIPISECGSGIQSLMIISLYNYYSSLRNSNVIFGIEEPEISLHPHSQKEFLNELVKGTSVGNNQIIMTTHSTVMIDQMDHLDVLLTRKVNDKIRGFKTELQQLSSNFWDKYGINDLKFKNFYKYKNSDFFFANIVIVVEGNIDAEVFRTLLKKNGVDLEKEGVSFLPLAGIKNFQYAYYLLKELKINKLFILDKDFFFDYINVEKSKSRGPDGFFKYKKTYKNKTNINTLLPIISDRDTLEKIFHKNQNKSNQILERYDTICMAYNLEMDLVASPSLLNEFYKSLMIESSNQSTKEILENYSNKIKKLDLLIPLVESIQIKNLPNSYNRIKTIITKKIKN